MDSVSEKMRVLIADIMEEDEPVDVNAELVNDIGMASIDFVELIVAIEKEFGVTITNETFSSPQTVHSLSALVAQKMPQKEPV